MKILGIESSFDETAASVVEDGYKLLSNVVHSQIDIHALYGGAVPEIAARSHIEVINPVINRALSDANVAWDDIDGIAVTYAPGLIGSLLVGTLAARTLAILKNKPLYPIHHVEAHVYANFLTEIVEGDWNIKDRKKVLDNLPTRQPEFPMLALIVSGGHTQLVLFKGHGDYELLGQTQDDAVGEAFDKVAKIIGLSYPGGPSISAAALNGDPTAYKLPKARLAGSYDFSFSGLKTAVLRAVQREAGVEIYFPSSDLPGLLNDAQRANFAASFQRTAVETLVETTIRAYQAYSPKSVVIAGGVAANKELRKVMSERLPLDIEYAPIELCTDNAAMIATLGYYYASKKDPVSPYDLEVVPSLSMSKTAWV
jgi:N6-L-threonylcarbamoyladenine synthase